MSSNQESELQERDNLSIDTAMQFRDAILNELEPKAKAVMRVVERMRAEGRQDWPSWCYAPSHVICAEIMRFDPLLTPEQVGYQCMALQAALTWANQTYVARFSPDLLTRVESVGANGVNQPMNALKLLQLPAYALLIDSRNILTIDGLASAGHLVHLDYIPDHPPLLKVISFLLDTEKKGNPTVLPIPHVLPLVADTSYTTAVQQYFLSEGVLVGMAQAPEPEEILFSAAHLAKISTLLTMLPKSEMDTDIRKLTANGDFPFDDQLQMIELAARPKYLH